MNLKPIDDKITVVLDMIERQHKNPHVAPDEKAATKRDLADLMLLKADLIKANPVNLTGSTIKIPDFDQHGTCPHCDNGHSLEPDETCETCNRYNAAAGRLCDPIPISAAKRIAKKYNYDQVIVIGRCVGKRGGEHVTTYGKNPEHCSVAAKIGDFIKYKIMGWESEGGNSEQ